MEGFLAFAAALAGGTLLLALAVAFLIATAFMVIGAYRAIRKNR